MLGLVMTAGGARGAYQVGVLKRVAELPSLRGRPLPFAIVTGASAGAINGTLLAANAARFSHATAELASIWSELQAEQVIRTDVVALVRSGASLARDFMAGSLLGGTVTRGVFDTSPLERLLERSFPAQGIEHAIRDGHLYACAVAATSYHSGRNYTFVQGRAGHPVWTKSRRVVLPVTLNHSHVMASAAIPIVFPPVRVRCETGELWFGDGGLRLVTPLSPAIRLGATHLFAVGIRCARTAVTLAEEEDGHVAAEHPIGVASSAATALECPPLAQICGVFMNAIFLDHLDTDIDHLRRMNELLAAESTLAGTARTARRDGTAHEPMRRVEALVVSPSADVALIARSFAHRLPRAVRYLLDALGTPDAHSADLMSYLLFDATFTRTLVDLGYSDAGTRIDEIEGFLESSGALDARRRRPAMVGAAAPSAAGRGRVKLEVAG
jgi:NTE family protein